MRSGQGCVRVIPVSRAYGYSVVVFVGQLVSANELCIFVVITRI